MEEDRKEIEILVKPDRKSIKRSFSAAGHIRTLEQIAAIPVDLCFLSPLSPLLVKNLMMSPRRRLGRQVD